MTHTQIEKARLSLKHAGTQEDQQQIRTRLAARLTNDIETLRQQTHAIQDDYRRRLERWRTEHIPLDTPVCKIPTDIHDSRLYRLTGIFALFSEMVLAAWVFARLGVPSFIGAASAVCITLTLHGIFLHVFNDPERPKQSIHRIRCAASMPAIFGFLIALALIVLARYVAGSLALLLLPLFSFALWLGTLSLLILAASLFTLAHLYAWSARHEKEYRQYHDEEQASADFLKELQSDGVRATQTIAMLPPRSDSRFDGRSAALPAIALIALVLSANTGCAPALTPAASATASLSAEAEPAPAAHLHIYIDWSGSPIRQALEEGWHTITQELPAIAERHHIESVSIWRFDEDGWCPKKLAELNLPVVHPPARTKLASTEWESFANFHDALRDEADHERAEDRKRYRAALAETLKQLDSAEILPPPNFESRNTDIAGLLKRISETRESAPQFLILMTDLADTHCKTLPPMPEPAGEAHVLALLVPAQEKDALLTIGKSLSGSEQFEFRSRQLHESTPWIASAPYFAKNLASLFTTGAQLSASAP